MSYSDTQEGCLDFCIPKDAQEATKAAFEFAKTSMLKTEEDGSKDWDYGPFSCLGNIPLTVAVACCPCWASCIRYRNNEYMSGKSCEVAFVNAMVAGAVCLGPCHYAVVRGQFRKKYGLKGSPCQDCMCGCCLGPCLLCADTNQLMVSQGIKVPYLNLKGGAPAS
ncbi:hypothetical protein PLESTB_001521500 [Pleodorina starrii]|uniref:PLAC8 family protein n=1 Tax=Pleodorina starrii TaxID=330485 RepID=A0A9W6BWT8_9CHLO|nr:hypothetical protein PLESTM_001867500 [Pleodorina starrii]GLC59678.1 hypothetical protein PLESTB_001521500 [Pleodorina starrii]GLC74643.1 hypothetical protein PLESTF_001538800 [Pleodorina starrii]